MDWELFESLGIRRNDSLKEICSSLEERQIELLGLIKTESDVNQKKQLKDELRHIDEQIQLIKSNIMSRESETQPVTVEKNDDEKEELLKKLSDLKKRENIRREREEAQKKAANAQSSNSSDNNKNVKPSEAQQNTNVSHNKPNVKTTPSGKTEGSQQTPPPIVNFNKDLQEGIKNYNQGNFSVAFAKFYKLANEGDSDAKYYLSIMYKNGQGTQKNDERFMFWIGEAAKDGNVEAQYAYAKVLLSSRQGTDPLSKEGMDYLEKAANQDNKSALKDYIEVVLSGYDEIDAINKAIKYCDSMTAMLTDQFEQQQYVDKKNKLQEILSSTEKRNSRKKACNIMDIIGICGLILGFAYWFGGVHPVIWDENVILRWLPDAWSFLILPIRPLWSMSYGYMDTNGQFGVQIIMVSCICLQANKAKTRIPSKTFKRFCYKFSKCVGVFFVLWHFIAQIADGYSMFRGFGIYLLLFVIVWIVGWVIGTIINKIFKLC